MAKIIAWFAAILLIVLTAGFVFWANLENTLLNPRGLKSALIEVGFYSQSKSIIKSSILSIEGLRDSEIVKLSGSLTPIIDQHDFQKPLEATIENIFSQLDGGAKNITLSYDLRSLKSELMSRIPEVSGVSLDSEISAAFPDQWKVDLSTQGRGLSLLSSSYQYRYLIFSLYFFLWLLLLLSSLLVGKKYLSLFFTTMLITSLIVLGQYLLFYFAKPSGIIAVVSNGLSRDIIDQATTQGGPGVQILIENIITYLRQHFMSLLFWESLPPMIVAIAGLIIVGISKGDKRRIPLND